MPPRKPLRLLHYDYTSPGAYFVTVCTRDRACLFGAVSGGGVQLSEMGKVVEQVWQGLPDHYPNFGLDEVVIMPNHIHGVLIIDKEDGRPLSNLMRAFKAFSTREIKAQRLTHSAVWQRGYYEHVVRDEGDLAVNISRTTPRNGTWTTRTRGVVDSGGCVDRGVLGPILDRPLRDRRGRLRCAERRWLNG